MQLVFALDLLKSVLPFFGLVLFFTILLSWIRLWINVQNL